MKKHTYPSALPVAKVQVRAANALRHLPRPGAACGHVHLNDPCNRSASDQSRILLVAAHVLHSGVVHTSIGPRGVVRKPDAVPKGDLTDLRLHVDGTWGGTPDSRRGDEKKRLVTAGPRDKGVRRSSGTFIRRRKRTTSAKEIFMFFSSDALDKLHLDQSREKRMETNYPYAFNHSLTYTSNIGLSPVPLSRKLPLRLSFSPGPDIRLATR